MTLREEVARAVQSTRLRSQRGGPSKLTSTDKQIADAAIAIVLERAAKVAEARVMGDRSLEDQEAERIAQAICALSEEGE